MKILHYIHAATASAFYAWAMREINPTHRDVPRIMRRQRELADKMKGIFK